MRPIDADALIKKYGDWYVEEGTESGFIGTLKNLLSTMPTVQPEKAQLSKESTTSDLISRTATINAVNNAFDRETLLTGFVRSIAVRAIRDMPSVQPEPTDEKVAEYCKRRCLHIVTDDFFHTVQPEPHEGYWIKHIDPFDGEQYECSECGVLWEFNDGTPEDNEAYFCPKCGKKLITK